MTTAFQFATIELLPYPTLGEFVIVGVIAVAEGRRMVAQVLPAQKTTRLTQFFPEIERAVFTSTLRDLREEFQQLSEHVNAKSAGTDWLPFDGTEGKALFNVLTSAREGMVRINARGAGMTDDLDEWVERSFERFVLRTADRITDPAEQTFTEQIRGFLTEWRLGNLYRRATVGKEHYHTTFPFAYTPEGAEMPERVIKPLHLGQGTPTRIIDHGDAWLQKIRRLRQFENAPEKIIFPVQLPMLRPGETDERLQAAHCLIDDYRGAGVRVIEDDDVASLRESVFVEPRFVGELFGES